MTSVLLCRILIVYVRVCVFQQFPNVLADPDCPYRYPNTSDSAYPAVPADSLPPSGHKLPSDYDPFKFLSAMAEQSLTGNFAPQAHASQSCAAANNNAHFLFSHNTSQMQSGFTSPGMTTSPPQFYTSQSSACCMYSSGAGSHRMGDYSPPGPEGDNYHQQTTVPGSGGGGGDTVHCKKNFLCSTEDLMESEFGFHRAVSIWRSHTLVNFVIWYYVAWLYVLTFSFFFFQFFFFFLNFYPYSQQQQQ